MKYRNIMNNNEISNKEMNEENEEKPDPLAEQFDGILQSLTMFRGQITNLSQQIRGLEKIVTKEVKVLKKQAAKKNRGNRAPSGFAKPSKISKDLSDFMDTEEDEVARTEVTQFLIKYIKENNLQNEENRKIIEPDEKLKILLKLTDEDELTYFNLQRYMNIHFVKKSVAES